MKLVSLLPSLSILGRQTLLALSNHLLTAGMARAVVFPRDNWDFALNNRSIEYTDIRLVGMLPS